MIQAPRKPSIARLFSRMAATLAIIVLVLPSCLYALFVRANTQLYLQDNLRIHALALEEFIATYPDTWDMATHRLQGLIERNSNGEINLRVSNNESQLLAELNTEKKSLTLHSSRVLHSFGTPVGQLEASYSIQQELFIGFFIFAGSLCFAWLIWVPLRGLPLKALASAQSALIARERYQRALLDNFPSLVWLKGSDGEYRAVNQKFAESFDQADTESFIGKTDFDLFPTELAETYQQIDQTVMSSGKPLQREEEFEIHGKKRWFDIYKSPVFQDDQPIGTVGYARDITEWKQAQQQLRIAATAFESQEGMFITDINHVILRVNRAFSHITGFAPEDIIGRHPNIMKSERHDGEFYKEMLSSLEKKGYWRGEIWNKRKNGEVYPQWLSITTVRDNTGKATNYVASMTDISQRKASEERIRNLALYDPLTQLPNRQLLLDRLQHALSAKFQSGHEGALLFIDLDDFRTLNDTLGHEKGDLLLQQVARRLSECLRDGDTVARLGGDEFVVMLEGLNDVQTDAEHQARCVGEKILSRLKRPFDLHGTPYHTSASIGITLFAKNDNSIDDLMKQADLAMYQAKSAGRSTLCFFDQGMQQLVTARASMESSLRAAIKAKQFSLHYQPQVNTQGEVTGAEALIRWIHPEKGVISPLDFIPLAETTGLILPLGDWVLRTACEQLATWSKTAKTAHLSMAVNVSARQFREDNFVTHVIATLKQTGAPGERLKLEITESLLLANMEDVISKMSALKAHGIQFSLDDFGTGYSSLSYLKRLPLDQLKIDKSFVLDVLTDPNDAEIAKTIIALAQSLKLSVIAEGVETEDQRCFLVNNGCHEFQGYLFSRPLPQEEFENLPLKF